MTVSLIKNTTKMRARNLNRAVLARLDETGLVIS